jgi:enamine deaminase RidA (YjgF/YER057c/UK114 family)
MRPEEKLNSLGLVQPPAPQPIATYVPYRLAGDLLFLSGQGPGRPDGSYSVGCSGATSRSSRRTRMRA